ncbi:hypothetical protein nbrc107696_02050 [Gordonia spumicola]|uniref:Uncharacterized protein n=1 Tax=Gordonia spumicola TaxID=589161 RepID=A0A7I9V2X8_9ACTN|nr:hypothetical protein [Gordonia spumicola]GED99758.1 hypothetical protein nbrc107696_02050 [Gordonia spumicola]
MSQSVNRAQRRARARETFRREHRLRNGLVALGAVAALGAGTVGATGVAYAAPAAPAASSSVDMGSLDFGAILGMLDDPMLGQFIEGCRTGSLASGPDSSTSTEYDPADPPLAIADCSGSNGTGIALVLPESIEVGQAAQGMEMDLGADINLLLVKYKMGKRNLLEVLGGVVLGSDTVKGLAKAAVGISVDPGAFDKYKTYDAVKRDAALPVNPASKDLCVQADGSTKNPVLGGCFLVGGTLVKKGADLNLSKRTEALKMAEYLTGHKYDYTKPQDLPAPVKPIGKSVISGDGVNIALSMRGATAIAQTRSAIALAMAGADHGRTSTASADLGIAMGVNMDTDDIVFTWFGQKLDFTKLRDSGLLTSDIAGSAGADADGMLDMIDGINGNLPGLKEVACFGLDTTATAEGLGTCSNYLGTFDYYKDLRPVTDGGHRQTQYGLTDVTSLFMGNDALLKQFAPMLGGDGDLGGVMDTPFMGDLLKALTSEDSRLKFAKDFVRYTQDVETTFAKEPVFEADGVTPKLDDNGKPVMKVKTAPRMVGVTHLVDEEYDSPVMVQDRDADGVLLWVDAKGAPVAEGAAGAKPKMVQKVENGVPVTEKKTRKVAAPTMVWVDAAGAEVAEGTAGATQVQKTEQAKDDKGAPIFDPVIERTTTAHWLTSDYGLREPLVIQWLGHELVFFPAVEVNGTTRPNLIGLPEIRRITDDAETGLLPKIKLVQWDNPFGLGTLTVNPFDPIGMLTGYIKSVTIVDDLKGVGDLVGALTPKTDSGATTPDTDTTPAVDETTPAADTAATTVVPSDKAPAEAPTSDPVVTTPVETPEPVVTQETAPVEEPAVVDEPVVDTTPEPELAPAS